MRNLTLGLLVSALSITSAMANGSGAMFSGIDGKALVKQDAGVVRAYLGMLAAPDSEIIVGLDASAQLVMDGCAIEMAAGSRFVVPAHAPCSKGSTFHVDGVQITPTNGLVAAPVVAAGIGGTTTVAVVAGVVVVAGVAGAIVVASDEVSSNGGSSCTSTC